MNYISGNFIDRNRLIDHINDTLQNNSAITYIYTGSARYDVSHIYDRNKHNASQRNITLRSLC